MKSDVLSWKVLWGWGGIARWQDGVREESILEVKKKLEGGVKDYVKISHSRELENGNIIMENWVEEKNWEEAKKSGNVHQAVGKAEVKFIRVFRIGEIANRFGRLPSISQRKSLGIIEGSTNYIPMKQTLSRESLFRFCKT